MTERGSSEKWSAAKASEPGNPNKFPIPPLIPGSSATPSTAAASVSAEMALSSQAKPYLPETTAEDLLEDGKSGHLVPMAKIFPGGENLRRKLLWLLKNWQFWVVLATISAGGVGIFAVALLLKLPAVPNCPSMYWPTASASMRLYCAQLAAKKQTVKDLLEAIALVKTLPADHPLREEANSQIKEWSLNILDLAQTSFDTGKIDEAIDIAKKIPNDVPAYQLVEKRLTSWKSLWSKAEGIYRNAEEELRKENFSQAFREAVRLLYIGNNYWETTKYEELNNLITSARDDGETLIKARNLSERGGVKNLLEAIKLAESIKPQSYLYQEAQKYIVQVGRKMMDRAYSLLEDKNVDEAIAIARQIPNSANLQAEVQDFLNLAEAQSVAREGSAASLEQAIAMVQKLSPDRPLYSKGQDFIIRWQREMQDIVHLDKARQLAQLGTASDLKSAIKEVALIPANHPRADEARAEISRWTAQIQTMEDRPYLERADRMAILGDPTSLQAAIEEAKQIRAGRALYPEAQEKIRKWTGIIQRIQDQPYLDRARQLASEGNLPDAIATAQQIRPGRALYGEAQSELADWQAQIRGQQNLQAARRIAAEATPDALVSAIRLASQVPSSSSLRGEAEDAMNQWGYQLLSQAQDRATYDIPGAIAIARTIPAGTNAFAEAKAQIQVWQSILNPPAPPAPSPPPVAPAPVAPAPEPTTLPEQPLPSPEANSPEPVTPESTPENNPIPVN